jgi:hypothetical protein
MHVLVSQAGRVSEASQAAAARSAVRSVRAGKEPVRARSVALSAAAAAAAGAFLPIHARAVRRQGRAHPVVAVSYS